MIVKMTMMILMMIMLIADHDSDDELRNNKSYQPVKVQELWGEEKAGPVFDLSKKITSIKQKKILKMELLNLVHIFRLIMVARRAQEALCHPHARP